MENKKQKVFVNGGMKLATGRELAGGHIYELDSREAQQVYEKDSGSIGMDMPEVDNYSNRVTKEVKAFKEGLKAIKESIDPRMQDDRFRQHHIDELKATLKENVKATQAEYAQFIGDLQEAAAQEAARHANVSDSFDRTMAESIVREIATDAKMGSANAALDRLENKVRYMDDSRKVAVSQQLPQLMDAVSGDEAMEKRVKAIYKAVKPAESTEEVFAKATKALSGDCTNAYRILTLTHPEFKSEKRTNIHNESRHETNYYPM